MSAYYEVDERFVITDYSALKDDFKNILLHHLTALVYDSADIERASAFQMTVKADEQIYSLSDDSTIRECRYVLGILEKSEFLHIITHYTGRISDFGRTPFSSYEEWRHYLISADDDFLSKVYCSFYTTDDRETDIGTMEAYGKCLGLTYHGEIPFIPAPAIPEGTWTYPHTAVHLDYKGNFEKKDVLRGLLKRLAALKCRDDTFISDSGWHFTMWAVKFESVREIEEYISCISALSELLGSSRFLGETEFYERKAKLRILRINTCGTKSVGCEMAEA